MEKFHNFLNKKTNEQIIETLQEINVEVDEFCNVLNYIVRNGRKKNLTEQEIYNEVEVGLKPSAEIYKKLWSSPQSEKGDIEKISDLLGRLAISPDRVQRILDGIKKEIAEQKGIQVVSPDVQTSWETFKKHLLAPNMQEITQEARKLGMKVMYVPEKNVFRIYGLAGHTMDYPLKSGKQAAKDITNIILDPTRGGSEKIVKPIKPKRKKSFKATPGQFPHVIS